MAEEDDSERSQEPTQKKLDDARKRGDVPKSVEVNTWFLLGAGTLALMMFSGSSSAQLTMAMKGFLGHAGTIEFGARAMQLMATDVLLMTIAALALPLLFMAVAAIVGNIVQNGFLWSLDPITPKFSKVSPIAGFGRLFSKTSLVNFAKGIAKLLIVGSAVMYAVWPEWEKLGVTTEFEPAALTPFTFDLIVRVLGSALAVLTVLAAADWLYQRQSWMERQKMSFQELKEEFKQQEGDPHVKAKIRQIRQQRSRKRMMAQVPQASVIITNPTHYAVALRYEKGMNAPLCLAKGLDAIALRIRAVAEEHQIPIVENPPLARALYAQVEVDDEIPAEHYKAVAEVVGYVMGLRRRGLR
ncbi:flagellar biosynthesis protein FlhB [Flaviflagellibacter deserti]|uniref:Flagellar biosynthetic protein FlhB n=1 Tax=Flaviflagellibacter deserti TaxID=2267266 RepID=A0ABV9Z912_9HYPH